MESRLTPDQLKGVTLVQDIARAQNMNVYLTGGAIRDIISGFPIRDLDFSVQGNPLKLQKDLVHAGAVIQGTDEDLKVVYALLPGNVRAEISMTRAEVYDKPGKPPQITFATINEDLRRRDFTINAMALSLNPGSRGLLADPFNGVADTEGKVIRILHNYAFLEEPSRLIRATRFAARFHWQLEERTQARYESAKENGYIEYISKNTIGYEIEQIAHEDDPLHIMTILEKEGWLKVLNPHWSISKIDKSKINQLMKTRSQMVDAGFSVDPAPAVMHFLTERLPDKDIADIQRLIPRKDFVHAWKHVEDGAKELAKRLQGKEAATPSRTWQLLTHANPEALLYLDVTVRQQAVEQKIKNFFGKWRQLKDKLPFPEMAELRITPQLPEYPKIAEEAFMLLLDGKLRSHTEVMKFLKPYEPPPPPPPPPPPTKRGRGAKAAAAAAPAGAAPVAQAPATPGKRGRKPKGEVAPAAPAAAAVPAVTGEAPKKGTPAKALEPAKKAVDKNASQVKTAAGVKSAPAKAPVKDALPAKKPAPPKKAAPAKKPTPKKPVPKKAAKPAKKGAKKK
jgi:tRNA nucleotidyltransferase (CCA-adding enzyme)